MPEGMGITSQVAEYLHTGFKEQEVSLAVLKLDYLSCVLTVFSTILIGKRYWEGWVLAAINSVIVCIIGVRTEQLGFVPANLFCIVMSGWNLRSWRKAEPS
jgi:nicotinamide riboside transporter PnuC